MQKDYKQDPKAERAVLGAIMIDNSSILKINEILKPEDFYIPAHTSIYNTMLEMHKENKPIDILTLRDCLSNKDMLIAVGDAEYLTTLDNPTAANITFHADIVKDKAIRRNTYERLKNLATQVKDESSKMNDIFSNAEKSFKEIVTNNVDNCKHVSDGLHQVYEKLTNPDYEENTIPSGLSDLDNLISGFHPKCVYALAGRPGMGKTALALNIARNVASRSSKVLIFSMEMSRELLQERLICSEAGIGIQESRELKQANQDMSTMVESTGFIHDLPIFINDTCRLDSNKVRSCALSAQLNHGVDFIIIDYLQLMGVIDKKAIREQQVAEMSCSLVALAKEMNVPILLLCQLNRDCEKRVNKRPVMSDIRESGALEQDAYAVMFIYRDFVYNANTENRNEAELIISKHRNGETGIVKLFFDASIMKFKDLDQHTLY